MDTEKLEELRARAVVEFGKVNRNGIDNVIWFLNENSDFFTAPASTRFHMSVKGGLLQHSLNVLEALRGILTYNGDGTYSYNVAGKDVLSKPISEESVIIMALFHDICKVNFYSETTRNRKDAKGNWESYTAYEVNDKFPYGHGEKSVMMLVRLGLELENDEMYAIRWHMGPPEGTERYTFDQAVEKFPIVWALHDADMLASHLMEGNEGNLPLFCTDN